MTTTIERQYRAVLRWFPRGWRAEHGDALVGTLLDVADAEQRRRAGLGERLGLAADGVAMRLDRVVPARVRDVASAVSLASGAVFSVIMVVVWGILQQSGLGDPRFAPYSQWFAAPSASSPGYEITTSAVHPFGPFWDTSPLMAFVWIAAFVFAAVGWFAAMRMLLVVSVFLAVFLRLLATWPSLGWHGLFGESFAVVPPSVTSLGLLVALAVVAFLGTPRSRSLLAGAAAAAVVVFGAAVLVSGDATTPYPTGAQIWANHGPFAPGWLFAGLTLVGVVAIGLAGAGRTGAAGVLALSAAPWVFVALWSGSDSVEEVVHRALVFGAVAVVVIAGRAVLRLSGYRIRLERRPRA